MPEHVLCLNGEILPEGQARLSPFDHGLTVGDGVFETLRTFGPSIFAWSRHDERLRDGASQMGIEVLPSDTLRAWATAVVEANGHPQSRVRVTATGGPAAPSTARGSGAATLLITATPLVEPPRETHVITVPWTRNERSALVGLKTTSYGENVRALALAHERDASEALFANTQGQLCEGTGTNVFLVRGDALQTPPLSSGCLAGVTRALVIELAGALGIEVQQTPLPFHALVEADEAFLTSTTRTVQGIAEVDGQRLPTCIGPTTQALSEAFDRLVARDLDP